jgi:hypothetical protein
MKNGRGHRTSSFLVYYFVKIFLVGVCIYIGAVVIAIEISFKKIFEMALSAEAAFLVPGIFQIASVHVYFRQTNYTLSEIQMFYPLSLLKFRD